MTRLQHRRQDLSRYVNDQQFAPSLVIFRYSKVTYQETEISRR